MLPIQHLSYLQDLLEGRAEVSWHAWFAPHEAELAAVLPRAEFLRLKFNKLDEAENLLIAAGVSYTPDPAAAVIVVFEPLHPTTP